MPESFLRNDKLQIKFLTLEQDKGLVMSWGQSYIMPMVSCDVIGVIEGVGWVMDNSNLTICGKFLTNLCQNILYIFPNFQ